MKKHLNQLLALLAFFCIGQSSPAQDDSAYLDLGRVKLRKDFTQHVTIKARDLGQMPFASLSDAIQPWLMGSVNNSFNTVFVVDGNLVNDVDAWSIYDIEEITLVQNALVQVNGTQKNQQLVLVRTKRKETVQRGLAIAGSSFLVTRDLAKYPQLEKESNYYHQYHITGWESRKSIRYGVSANFLRDVFPAMHDASIKVHTPQQANRFRINGWLNYEMADGHVLSAQLNYTPQVIKENYYTSDPTPGIYNYKNRQSLWNPAIRLTDRIARGLTNELDASFVTARGPYTQYFNGGTGQNQHNEGNQKVSNLLIRERISYKKNLGNWQIEPSLNFSARIVDQTSEFTGTWWNNNQVYNIFHFSFSLESEVYMLTPAFSVSRGNSFYFQGGLTTNLGDKKHPAGEGLFPFGSLSVDLLRISKPGNPYSLQLFASYTRAGNFEDYYYSQGDAQYPPGLFPSATNVTVIPGGAIFSQPYPQDPRLSCIQAGARFSSPAGRLEIGYNYDSRKYVDQMYFDAPSGTGFDYVGYWPEFSYTSHRIAVNARVLDGKIGEWRTGINATAVKYDADEVPLSGPGVFLYYGNAGKTLVSGGWVNRIRLLDFIFGLDLLYLFNEQYQLTQVDFQRIDSWRINNVYAGYRLSVAKNKPLEVYISSRNFLQNRKSNLPDDRQFYGAGFRLQL